MLNRLKALRTRHEILDAKIDREQKRLRPDVLRVSAMKKIRLRLRDQITRIEFVMTRNFQRDLGNRAM
ncbi:MAG: YdcH family protein [Stappiaceae bacterium]